MKYPEISKLTKKYWDEETLLSLNRIESFADMFFIAKKILSQMPDNLGQVCGPISNGGLGSKEKNLEYFSKEIDRLQREGVDIFDQMPFEEHVHRLFDSATLNQNHEDILNDFYLPIFLSGKIKTLYFVEGWETSKGAKWEHDKAESLGLNIVYL